VTPLRADDPLARATHVSVAIAARERELKGRLRSALESRDHAAIIRLAWELLPATSRLRDRAKAHDR
jgi:hypothetical protein